jgi:hypothetical protein
MAGKPSKNKLVLTIIGGVRVVCVVCVGVGQLLIGYCKPGCFLVLFALPESVSFARGNVYLIARTGRMQGNGLGSATLRASVEGCLRMRSCSYPFQALSKQR